MTDGEWEIFWNVLDARRQRQRLDPEEEECSADECSDAEVAAEGRQPEEAAGSLHIAALVTDATSARRRNTMRSNRCGSCQACQSVDCGTCKNCLDKPRFGGPGIKKKACVRRICTSLPKEGDGEGEAEEKKEAFKEVDNSDTETASLSSPQHPPTARANTCAPPQFGMLRPPLLPLDVQSAPVQFSFHLQSCQLELLSRAAPPPYI